MNSQQWQGIWFQAVARAWSDNNFKSELLQDARGALSKHFDFQVPGQVNLTVVEGDESSAVNAEEDSTHSIFLTLPPRPGSIGVHSLDVGNIAAQSAACPCCPC